MVKDIKWLEKDFKRVIDQSVLKTLDSYDVGFNIGLTESKKIFDSLISRLDETKTLSPEWLTKNSVKAETIFYPKEEVVPKSNLKNLLVPIQEEAKETTFNQEVNKIIQAIEHPKRIKLKNVTEKMDNMAEKNQQQWLDRLNEIYGTEKQEDADQAYKDGYEKGKEHATNNYHVVKKPVIPRFVADWFKDNEEYNLYGAFSAVRAEKTYGYSKRVHNWVGDKINSEAFALAKIYGYKVEEKQAPKYYILNKNRDRMLLVKRENKIQENLGTSLVMDYGSKLTEQEIKYYDERFWPFAVPIEEIE